MYLFEVIMDTNNNVMGNENEAQEAASQGDQPKRKDPQSGQENVTYKSNNQNLTNVLPKEGTTTFRKQYEEAYSMKRYNEWLYKKYLTEEFYALVPYDHEQPNEGASSCKTNTSSLSVQTSNTLLLNQPLLDNKDWLYDLFLTEEFEALMPYDYKQSEQDIGFWTTNIFSVSVQKPSKLWLLLNQLPFEDNGWQKTLRRDPPLAMPVDIMDLPDPLDC